MVCTTKQGAVGVSGDDDKLQFWVQVMCQLCQLHDFTSFARIGDEQQQVILLEDAEVTMLCFAGVQENGRNTGRAEGGGVLQLLHKRPSLECSVRLVPLSAKALEWMQSYLMC